MMKSKIFKLSLLAVSLFFSYTAKSQCSVTIQAANDTVDCGSCFDLTAEGEAQDTLLNEDFNNSSLGPGWSSNQTVMYTNPCGAPPDNSPSAWFGDSQTQPRVLETIDYDMSCGGDICYMMKYSVQGGSGSCEGPDQPNEGVDLQYSTDGGATWTSIFYHTVVGGGTDPYQTSWNQYCQEIPPGAQTPSTRFRWYQDAGSGAGFDHWGIDDVAVLGTICGTYYYDWFADGTTNSADTNLCLSQNVDTYDVIFTDGLSDTCSASIDIYSAMAPNLPNDTSICGLIDTNIFSNPTGGSGDYSYQWNTNETDSFAASVSTGEYYVDMTDANYPNCTASDTMWIGIFPYPVADFEAFPLCDGVPTEFTDSTSISSGSIASWDWDFDDLGSTSTDQNPTYQFSGIANYDVNLSVESDQGCTHDTTITIQIGPRPFADFDYDNACEDQEVPFENTSAGDYESIYWSFENGSDSITIEDPVHEFSGAGDFDVTLIAVDSSGACADTLTETVTIYPLPDVVFDANPQVGEPPLPVDFYNQSTGAVSYEWDFANGNFSNDPSDTVFETFDNVGLYDVVLTGLSAEGCSNSYSLVIKVEYPDLQYVIPNVVTPNGDGVNDDFFINFIQARETITSFEIVILNRWGNVIRTSDDPDFEWDGTRDNGKQVSDGTYFYKVRMSTVKGKDFNEHGFIQVETD